MGGRLCTGVGHVHLSNITLESQERGQGPEARCVLGLWPRGGQLIVEVGHVQYEPVADVAGSEAVQGGFDLA
jgi:hypothetical protein